MQINTGQHPVDRTLNYLRKAARSANDDRGPLRTISTIKQAVGADKEAVRGYLIKLVARGEIMLHDWSGGQCWEAVMPKPVAPVEAVDGHFVLQREVIHDQRAYWIDGETFTNCDRAKSALKFAQSAAQYRAREWGRPVQRIRLLQAPAKGGDHAE